MEWKLTKEPLTLLATDAIIVFHAKDRESTQSDTREVDEALDFRISTLISEGEVTGSLGEVTVLLNWAKLPSGRVLLSGLGQEERIDLQRVKDAVASAARKAKQMKLKQIAVGCPSFLLERYNSVDVVQSIVEGIELGAFEQQTYKSSSHRNEIETVWFSTHALTLSAIETGMERGQVFARSTNLARFLVNEPSNHLTPQRLAEYAKEMADNRRLKIEILEESELRQMNMNALLTVSRGSSESAKMIAITYMGAPDSKEILGLVGKGITFDSGGLQIKSHTGMKTMKGDMGGAAAVIGAMDAIGALQPHCNVIGVIPTCENMASGSAYRPGDVITTFSNKTIEVVHTDAEGRIILADGVAYAKRLGVTRLVDVATLTGAIVVALGNETTGLFTNEEEWGQEVKVAARIAGEKVWELPLFEEYEEYIKSEIADVKNSSGSIAGAITAALFIREFVGSTPWVHLDIAGTAESRCEKGIQVKGSTGSGVRTLIQLAIRFA